MRRKILIVRRENIGDLILTTPLIRALRLALPDAHIATLVNSYNAPVLAGNEDIDEVFVYTKGKHAASLWQRLVARIRLVRLYLRLRALRFDDVVLAEPTYSMRNIRLAKFVVGGAGRAGRRIVGFEDDDGTTAGLDAVASKANMAGLHQAEIMLRLAPALGVSVPAIDLLPCQVGSRARLGASPVVSASDPLVIGLHISARKPSQRWAVENFAALAVALTTERVCERPVQLAVFWSPGATDNALHPGDDAKAAQLAALLATTATTASTPGTSATKFVATHALHQLIDGLATVDLLVCADGGAMHVAAGLGKPIVALFGDSNPVRWQPWGVPRRVLQATSRDVSAISAEEVLAAVNELVTECHLGDKFGRP